MHSLKGGREDRMKKQNIIAKWLCKLGGDKYTVESTENALRDSLNYAQKNSLPFDIRNDKLILVSDLHKGGKNRADDFRHCEAAYVTALSHYFEQGYRLCVMGDAEELWEEFPRIVIQRNSLAFAAEKQFHEAGRYLRIWGNHDEIWGDEGMINTWLQPAYGEIPLRVVESILLNMCDGNETLGRILLVHGHQGTQFSGKNLAFPKWILHNIWRPVQVVTGFSCNTPATDWRLRLERDKIFYHWASQQPGLVLIGGHTHTPVFASYSHRARLIKEISEAGKSLASLTEAEHAAELARIEKMSADLRQLESQLTDEERKTFPAGENPRPCYFNTGCCAFEDGDITGIEIADGEIRLVRWPDDENRPMRKVLQSESLVNVFSAVRQAGG
jgi:hypothetical protein